MRRTRRFHARTAALGATLALALVIPGIHAGALQGLPITCTGAGTVGYVDGSPTSAWTVAGKGSCSGNLEGTYFMEFAGSGTSRDVGICTDTPFVRNFDLLVTSTLVNAATAETKTFTHRWTAPVTTYPVATPFVVEHVPADVPIGAGVFFNHVFGNCAGSPVANFTWTFLT